MFNFFSFAKELSAKNTTAINNKIPVLITSGITFHVDVKRTIAANTIKVAPVVKIVVFFLSCSFFSLTFSIFSLTSLIVRLVSVFEFSAIVYFLLSFKVILLFVNSLTFVVSLSTSSFSTLTMFLLFCSISILCPFFNKLFSFSNFLIFFFNSSI